jgi:hypothetical protein
MRWLLAILLVVLAGCTSPGMGDGTGNADYTAQQLYEIKCAKCHKFYDPANYSQEDWDMWMRKMSRKAKLNPAQRDLLSEYLETFRQKPAPKQ